MSIKKGESAQLNFTAKAFRKLRRIALNVKEFSVRDIVDYLFNEIHLDPSFQVETTRWTVEQMQSYIISLIEGLANHPISVCLIEKSGDQLRKHYQYLSHIFAYISVDGNDRLNAIIKYINNEFPLTFPEEGVFSEDVNFTEVYYRDLPEDVQKEFQRIKIFFHVYEVDERNDLSTLFKRLSSGTPLNDQEVRNCYPGIVSTHVRDWSKKLRTSMKPVDIEEWSSDVAALSTNSRRSMDEFLAKWLYRVSNPSDGTGIKSSKLDAMYRMNSASPSSCKRHREQVQVLCDTFNYATGYSTFSSWKDLTKSRLANYLVAVDIAMSLDYEITNPAEFFTWFWQGELNRLTTPVDPATRASIVTACKKKDPMEWAKQTAKADKEKYSSWSTNALDNTTKVKKRAAMIKSDFDNAVSSLVSDGIIVSLATLEQAA